VKRGPQQKTIDWNDLRQGYNDKYSTNYLTVFEFVAGIYNKCKTIENAAHLLGISRYLFWTKMKVLGIPSKLKGWRGPSPCLQAIWKLNNVQEMTTQTIADATGYNRSWCLTVLKRHNIKWAKGKHFVVDNPEDECICPVESRHASV
jgi:hypothetical protein